MTSFDAVFPMMGWDKLPEPQWQMVPVNGDRYVYLHSGAGQVVSSLHPEILTVTEVRDADLPWWRAKIAPQAGDRIFRLHGVAKGYARVRAMSGATVSAVIEVDTKKTLRKRVAFNFLKDSAVPPHKTRRPPAEAAEWVRIINVIYQQCNVEIISESAKPLTVPGNWGRAVTWSPSPTSEAAKLTLLGDPIAHCNVFQVWEYEQDGTEAIDNANGATIPGIGGKTIIVEDNAATPHAHTVAHELGHFLGLSDIKIPAKKHHLMYGADRTGQHLDKSEVNTMNQAL